MKNPRTTTKTLLSGCSSLNRRLLRASAPAITDAVDKINRPSLLRWAIGFLLGTYFSTSKASSNDSKIVIVVIIIVGETVEVLHNDGIIAQRHYFRSVFFMAL
jgi:hypothetical protein